MSHGAVGKHTVYLVPEERSLSLPLLSKLRNASLRMSMVWTKAQTSDTMHSPIPGISKPMGTIPNLPYRVYNVAEKEREDREQVKE